MVLTTVAGGYRLAPAEAASYDRMCAARGSTLAIESAYRDSEQQAELYAGWVNHLPGYNFALAPGKSEHEHGRAVDFRPSSFVWLEAHAAEHGWFRTNKRERWHYEYDATRDRHLTDAPAAPASLAPTPPSPAHLPTFDPEDDMNAKDQIIALYVYLLGRLPDATGLAGWLVDMGAGKATLVDVEAKIRGSQEYGELDPAERVRKRLALSIW